MDFTNLFAVIKDGDPAGPYNTVAQAAKEAGAVTINYGVFINAIIMFIIVALVLFFIVKAYMKTQKPAAVTTKDCPFCTTGHPARGHPLPAVHLGAARRRQEPEPTASRPRRLTTVRRGGARSAPPRRLYSRPAILCRTMLSTLHHDHGFFATCPRNTEGLLLDELRSLGAADAAETRAGVAFTGPLPLAYRACLWSRVASRVLLRLTSFPASSPDDLYDGVARAALGGPPDARPAPWPWR